MFDTESCDPSGTLFVLEAESLEVARVIVQNDPSWTGDVMRVVFFTLQNECAAYGVFACSGIKKRSRSKLSRLPSLALSRQRPECVLLKVL